VVFLDIFLAWTTFGAESQDNVSMRIYLATAWKYNEYKSYIRVDDKETSQMTVTKDKTFQNH